MGLTFIAVCVFFVFFGIWFSVFVIDTSAFSVLVSDVVVGFSYFVLFGLRFLGSHVSNDARDFGPMVIWSVSSVPPAPAMEEAIVDVDCVAFFSKKRNTITQFHKKVEIPQKACRS